MEAVSQPPAVPNKYANGKIYKLVSPHTPKVYIGSTIKSLNERLQRHKIRLTQFQNGRRITRVASFELLVLGDVTIELLEEYPCDSALALRKQEQYWIEQYSPLSANYQSAWTPTRTTCACGKSVITGHLMIHMASQACCDARGVEYDPARDVKRQQYLRNRERMLARRAERVECACGLTLSRNNHSSHKKSKRHQAWEAANQTQQS